MKKIIFIVILGCITSCTDNLPKYSCVYYSIIDNFPKGVKEMEFENRDICCILKFYNRSSDSVYIPCNGLSGGMELKSCFVVKNGKYEMECPARFWYPHLGTRIVPPHDSVRIGVTIYSESLYKLHLDKYIDIRDLDRKIKIYYRYDPVDAVESRLKTPPINITKREKIDYIYGATMFVEFDDYSYVKTLKFPRKE